MSTDSLTGNLSNVLFVTKTNYTFHFSFQVKITALACSICYLLGLPCTSRAGAYILDLMDTYGAGKLFYCILQLLDFSMQPHCCPQGQTTKKWGQTMKKLQSWTTGYFFIFKYKNITKNATKHPVAQWHDQSRMSTMKSKLVGIQI